MTTTLAIILAAGDGRRAGGEAKQWRLLAGRPVIAHAVAAFAHHHVIVAIRPSDRERARAALPGIELVEGGATRADSVRAALVAAEGRGFARVLVHDGARPFPAPGLIARIERALDHAPAAAPALAVTDALWRGEGGRVLAIQPRAGLFRAQTPQGFRFDAILAAHRAHGADAADDVEVALAAGLDVAIVEGDEDNLKLTHPGDFARAERVQKGREVDIRTGTGFDVHAFTEGDHLWLCGLRIAHGRALAGHSDADVGMHALTDAIYGALAEGDIGRHFPPSDPRWKGAASHVFLAHAAGLAAGRGYRIGNADVTLICEAPKIGPHADAMRAALAGILGVEAARIGVKATTTERLGFTGREEGIAAMASVLLVRE